LGSELIRIKGFMQQLVQSVSTLIKLEIQVFDPERNIVAGTNNANDQLGLQYKGRLTFQTVETGNTIVARSPGHCAECLTCKKFRDCIYYFVIASPLINHNGILGSFCLSAITEQQKQAILNNEQSLVYFLDRMSALIVNAINEKQAEKEYYTLLKRYYNIANSVQEGLITTDTLGKIIDINLSAANLLDIKAEQITSKSFISLFPDFKMSLAEEIPPNTKLSYRTRSGNKNLITAVVPIYNPNLHDSPNFIISLKNSGQVKSYTPKQAEYTSKYTFEDIKSESPAIFQLKEKLKKASLTDSNILICGESGAGKEMFAHAVHSASKRANNNFITVNCSTIPENLLESELFGYEEGAFTGAMKGGKPGKFELAEGGTIFLDEIGEIPLWQQSKLLRVLENREIERVGGIEPIAVDVRIIAATNKPLEQMVESQEFRRDLFYRLNVIPAFIPPLRERAEDIDLLTSYFLNKYTTQFGRPAQSLDSCTKELLNDYSWPGNIRELQNTIEYAINISEPGQIITSDYLPQRIHFNFMEENKETPPNETLKDKKDQAILEAIARFGNTTKGKKRAAAYLGISLSTIKRHLKNIRQLQ